MHVLYFTPSICIYYGTLRSYSMIYILQTVVLTDVKSRPVLHHCVVIFFWSSGIMECTFMLFTFENGDLLALGGISGVASFITTDEQLQ